MIHFEPSEEQALIVETVRQFAENEIRPLGRECEEGRELPSAVLSQAHELGLVSTALPEAHGGGGERSALTGCLVAEELAWGDLSIALAILSPSLAGLPLADLGTKEQQAAEIPALCGPKFLSGSLAWVEPFFGFDPLHPRTTATSAGGKVRLDGRKCFVPWLGDDGPLLVVAREGESNQVFLVPRSATGLRAHAETNLGIRGLPTVELELDGVEVAAEARLADGTSGLGVLLDRGRVALAALAVGVARASYEIARDYAKQRETFGAPIATRQAIAFKLADMAIEIDGTRLLTWEAAWRLDQGKSATREAVLAYDKAKRVSRTVADGAVQVLGGHGYIRDYLPELHLRNAVGFGSFEGLALV